MIKKPPKFELIIWIIVAWPMLFYSYLLFPSSPSTNFFAFEIVSLHTEDLQVTVWLLYTKFNLIVLLSIWFFTNKKWWRYSKLPLLAVSFSQFFGHFYAELVDPSLIFKYSFEISTFIILLVIIVYLIIDRKINSDSVYLVDILEADSKNMLAKLIEFDKKEHYKLEKQFRELRVKRKVMKEKNYLYELIALQRNLIINSKEN